MALQTIEEFYNAIEEDASVGSAYRELLFLRHWFHELSVFDGRTGETVPRPLGAVCEFLRTADKPIRVPKDRLYRIFEHICDAIEEIFARPNERFVREHATLPLHAVRELDSSSFSALCRRPGRTIREKLAGKPYVQAVKRTSTVDTAENRLLKAFCQRLAECLRCRADTFRESEAGEVVSLLNRVQSWLRSPEAGAIGRWEILPPNNILLQHRDYRRIWDAWGWQQTLACDTIRDFHDRFCQWATVLFWTFVSRLQSSPRIRLLEQPCYFDYDQFGLTSALTEEGYLACIDGVLLSCQGISANHHPGIVDRLGVDRNQRGFAFCDTADGRSVFVHSDSFADPSSFEDVRRTSLLFFELRQSSQGWQGTHVLRPLKPTPFSVGLTEGLDIVLQFQGASAHRLVSVGATDSAEAEITLGNRETSVSASLQAADELAESLASALIPESPNCVCVGSPEESLSAGDQHVTVDIAALRPRVYVDGQLSVAPFRMFWQLWCQSGRENVEVDLGRSTAVGLVEDCTNVGILDLLGGSTMLSPGVLNQAARCFADKLVESCRPGSLTYLMPDAVDDFSSETIRRNLNAKMPGAEPLPRSIAAVFDWVSEPTRGRRAIENGDCVVVIDSVGDELCVTPVDAHYDEELEALVPKSRGICWERHPPILCRSSFSSVGIATEILEKCRCPWPNDLGRTLGLQGILESGPELSWTDGRDWFTLPEDVEDHVRHATSAADMPWHHIETGIGEHISGLPTNARVFVMTLGEVFAGNQLGRLPRSVLMRHRAVWIGNRQTLVRGGAVSEEWKNMAGHVSLWRDHLPELSMRVIGDNRIERFPLVTADSPPVIPKRGAPVPIPIDRTFVLPAGEAYYQFPLLQGSEGNELRYEAYLKSSAFELPEDVEVRLHLTYSYGSDTPYELTFIPVAGQRAGFKSVRAEWRLREEKQEALYPTFPHATSWQELQSFPRRDSHETRDLLQWAHSVLKRLPRQLDALDEERQTGTICSAWQEDSNGNLFVTVSCERGFVRCYATSFLDSPDTTTIGLDDTLSFRIVVRADGKLNARDIAGGPGTEGDAAARVLSGKLESLAKSMRRGLRFPFFTIFGAGRSLTEADTPDWFRQTMQEGTETLVRLLGLPSALRLASPLPVAARVADEALLLLCCMHRDAPRDAVDALLGFSEKIDDSHWPFIQHFRHIAFALGAAELPWQQQLLDRVLTVVDGGSPLDAAVALEILGIAVWRAESLLDKLQADRLQQIVPRLAVAIEHDLSQVSGERDFVRDEALKYHLELLLGLLRTRSSEDPKVSELLAPGKPVTRRLTQLIERTIDRVFEHHVPIRSRIGLAVAKPEALQNTPDLVYALRLYLTGDTGARAIRVTAVQDDESDNE